MSFKNKIKSHLGEWIYYICLIIGLVLGLYVTFWVMIIDPIIGCVNAISNGTLVTSQVLITILSCIFSGTFGCIVITILNYVGLLGHKIIDEIMDEISTEKFLKNTK